MTARALSPRSCMGVRRFAVGLSYWKLMETFGVCHVQFLAVNICGCSAFEAESEIYRDQPAIGVNISKLQRKQSESHLHMLFGFKNQQFQHGSTKAHHILRISPLSGPSQLPLEGHLDMACQWRHATLARNGVLFAMPWQATAVLRVEPSLAKVRQLGSLPVTQQGKFGFTVAAQEMWMGYDRYDGPDGQVRMNHMNL